MPDRKLKRVDAEYVLLDYMQTLVENGKDPECRKLIQQGRYRDWIQMERLRAWLIELLEDRKVILMTARHQRYRNLTMSIIGESDLNPIECHFNEFSLSPPDCKQRVLIDFIYPKYGHPDPGRYLALESNPKTRAMYAANGIEAIPVPYKPPFWSEIPKLIIPDA